MNDRHSQANAELQALGAAYQGGSLSREAYRERRRALITSLRVRDDVTERNPLVAGGTARRASPAREAGTVADPGASGFARWKWLLAAAMTAGAMLAMAWLAWGSKGEI
jgi:hypothetical protein